MNIPGDLKYSKSHEWIRYESDTTAYIGITDYAQEQLGDLVFVNLPMAGDPVTVDESFADVESVKAVSDVISPVSGVIDEINDELADSPEMMNEKPYEAWFVKVSGITAEGELLTAEEYGAFIREEENS